MIPADDWVPAALVGKRVAFRENDSHTGCWHCRSGLTTGTVLRVCPTLAQKAELLGPEGFPCPDMLEDADEVPRLWVRADACPSFPQGCEIAVDRACLLLAEES